jgi:hypothetical protein
MVEVGSLNIKDIFHHKGHQYEVLENNSVFIMAKKIPNDGITRYFLKSIKVKKKVKDSVWLKNPDYDITDRWQDRVR